MRKDHCAAVFQTVDEVAEMLDALSPECESNLEAARKVLAIGRGQTLACSCQAAADGFTMQIENSKSTRYFCGNTNQSLRTIRSSLGDPLICYDG